MTTILQIALPVPLRRLFDYTADAFDARQLKPGIRVKVPFGKRSMVGMLIKTTSKSEYPIDKLKPIIELLDDEPLMTPEIFNLCQWAADYYHHPIGEIFMSALPAALKQGKPATIKRPLKEKKRAEATQQNLILSDAQQKALQAILNHQNQFQPFLLQGVTGSGKTEVYLQAIEQIIAAGKQALVLVPEIALTPQTIKRFENRFNEKVISLHSSLTPKKRLEGWLLAKSGEAKIIIGTRSAIFTPTKNLGMIIIDEEHDLSFKQQEKFRYSAKNLAIILASRLNIPVVLGSATPSIESLHNIVNKNFIPLHLPERAGNAVHPSYHLIDIRNETLDHGISKALLKRIEQHLENDSQVLLFLNRRGYAPTLMCHSCGWIASCTRCDVHLTLHHQPAHLHCHHCDTKKTTPTQCPECGKKSLQNIGVGTERLEKSLHDHFPDTLITRIDRDTTRKKESIEKLLEQVHSGEKQILIGTQMIAKGHHFPNVTLVGIINADAGFFSADFRATERMGQLLVQVSGRAGRAEKPGEVFIQTHYPDHPFLRQLTQHGYHEFAKFILKERKESRLPPYSHFALMRAYAVKEEHPETFLNMAKTLAEENDHLKILGPIPAPMPKRKGMYQSQLLFQSPSRQALQTTLQSLLKTLETKPESSRVKWNCDVDPLEMY